MSAIDNLEEFCKESAVRQFEHYCYLEELAKLEEKKKEIESEIHRIQHTEKYKDGEFRKKCEMATWYIGGDIAKLVEEKERERYNELKNKPF